MLLAVQQAEGAVYEALAVDDTQAALTALGELSAPIDRFFEHVMVMDPDEKIRANRMSLLSRIIDLSDAVADLRQIVE